MNFTNELYQKAYYSLFNGLVKAGLDIGNQITRSDYANGYALFAFDLTPDVCNGDHFNLVKNGNLRISLVFDGHLGSNINCIVYMEYENIIEINKSRNILWDFKVS